MRRCSPGFNSNLRILRIYINYALDFSTSAALTEKGKMTRCKHRFVILQCAVVAATVRKIRELCRGRGCLLAQPTYYPWN